ncbi:MAG TPA: sugar transferase [Bryobacteraceae bacterium]|nr:sugar transferase [Bryobacteraceae bacterium]
MFRSQQRKTKILFGLSDIILAALAFELAYRFREHLHLDKTFYLLPDVKTLLICFSAVTSVAAGYWLNVYGKVDSAEVGVILRDSFRQIGYGAITIVLFIVFGLQVKISRVFLASFFAANWVFLALFRLAARNLVQTVAQSFGSQRHVLIVGLGERAERLGHNLEGFYPHGLRILGFLTPDDSAQGTVQLERTYQVFPISELRSLLARHVVDEIHFAVESNQLPALEEVFLWCDEEGVCTRLAVDFFPHVNSELALERLGHTPMLTFTAAPDDEVLLLAKRAIDIALSLIGIVLLSPVLLLIAVLVKLTSPGPVIFSQRRCGLNGRMFTFYKFRSMVEGAEQRFHEVAHLTQREVATKIPNDPRQTPIGRFLRKFSLDELPQLFNVLKGDMSLVGPRPAIPSEVAQYQRWQRRRLRMRPGLTCLWAVEGRDNIDFETWMRMDLQYIDNWSLGLDARIIILTIPYVLSGRGAN